MLARILTRMQMHRLTRMTIINSSATIRPAVRWTRARTPDIRLTLLTPVAETRTGTLPIKGISLGALTLAIRLIQRRTECLVAASPDILLIQRKIQGWGIRLIPLPGRGLVIRTTLIKIETVTTPKEVIDATTRTHLYAQQPQLYLSPSSWLC